MKKIVSCLIIASLALITLVWPKKVSAQATTAPRWQVQSIDTMKYSRDRSREVLANPSAFTSLIDLQMAQIASTGATHVAIATPYDHEFIPVLRLWVDSARRHDLKVWYRGNWSGWEGWFEYARISREEHLELTRRFIRENPTLFQHGDIFTPCPECENGGPGDPRQTGDVAGFRQFMIEEYRMTQAEFNQHGVFVRSNLASMNLDVARLVMDPSTTSAMGGVVTVDHYVSDAGRYGADLQALVESSQAVQIMLGEIGAPIPDLHGEMTPAQQALWLGEALAGLSEVSHLMGLNYWVGHGGSTELWREGNAVSPAADVLKRYFILVIPPDTVSPTPLASSSPANSSTPSPLTSPTSTLATPLATVKPRPPVPTPRCTRCRPSLRDLLNDRAQPPVY